MTTSIHTHHLQDNILVSEFSHRDNYKFAGLKMKTVEFIVYWINVYFWMVDANELIYHGDEIILYNVGKETTMVTYKIFQIHLNRLNNKYS